MFHYCCKLWSFFFGNDFRNCSLILNCFYLRKEQEKNGLNIKEITTINEMALTIGLIMLTIGNFLGGMWANESWGRYWGWDPKKHGHWCLSWFMRLYFT